MRGERANRHVTFRKGVVDGEEGKGQKGLLEGGDLLIACSRCAACNNIKVLMTKLLVPLRVLVLRPV